MRSTIAASVLLSLASAECMNLNFGRTDNTREFGCEQYDWYPSMCGDNDTAEFIAGEMCCACGGGTNEPRICSDTNNGNTDTTGDQCGWYDRFPWTCGNFDSESFIAREMCCGCGGGCLDKSNGATDSAGDGCGWYKDNQGSCGNYDTESFKANEMCCECQGG